MKIDSSLDWLHVKSILQSRLSSLPYNPDLKKMLFNIEKMVDELSKLEVVARRTKKLDSTKLKVNAINKSIDHLEKLLLIAELMR